jgi:hypothetical protein
MISGQRLSLKHVDLGKPAAAVPLNFPLALTSLLLLVLTVAAGYASRRGAI